MYTNMTKSFGLNKSISRKYMKSKLSYTNYYLGMIAMSYLTSEQTQVKQKLFTHFICRP